MSLDTYAGLKDSLRSWLNKSTNVISDDVAEDLIRLCEAQMSREITSVGQIDTWQDIDLDANGYRLPCRVDEIASVSFGGVPLSYLSPDRIGEIEWNEPGYYTVDGGTLKIASGGTVTVRLMKAFCPLSASVSSNWILEQHPDAYLYGSLMQAAPFLRDDERMGVWASLFRSAMDSINQQVIRRQSGGLLRAQAGVTP